MISASLDQRAERTCAPPDRWANQPKYIHHVKRSGRLIARLVDAQGSPSSGPRPALYECRYADCDNRCRWFGTVRSGARGFLRALFRARVLIERALWQGALSFEDEMVNAGDIQLAGMVSVTGVIESETGAPVSGEILTLTTQDQTTTFRRSSNELDAV